MHRHDWHVNKGVPGDAVPRGREGELPARQRRHLRQERRRVSESFHQWQISGRNSRTAEETTRRIFTKVHLHLLISRLNQYIERALFRIIWQDPWSSGYGWWLMFERLCFRIPVLYTGWTFFNIDLLSKLYCLFGKTENKQKEAGVGPLKTS